MQSYIFIQYLAREYMISISLLTQFNCQRDLTTFLYKSLTISLNITGIWSDKCYVTFSTLTACVVEENNRRGNYSAEAASVAGVSATVASAAGADLRRLRRVRPSFLAPFSLSMFSL